MAELLATAARRRRYLDRLQARLSACRSALRRLRRSPWPRFQGRPEADWPALLHGRPGAEVPSGLADPEHPQGPALESGDRLKPGRRSPGEQPVGEVVITRIGIDGEP